MDIPLLNKTSIQQIWEEQKQHISCIQDVGDPAIQVYTQTGTLKKSGVELPIYTVPEGQHHWSHSINTLIASFQVKNTQNPLLIKQ